MSDGKKFNDAIQNREFIFNSAILSREQYFKLVSEIKNKQSRTYRLSKRYGIMVLNGVETLIYPASKKHPNIKIYDLFGILHKFHQSVGHGGKKRGMIDLVKTWYKNISKSEIKLYLSLCVQCNQKQNLRNKGIVKPIVFEDFNRRYIIDLIDFQCKPDGDYKYICDYQDYLTKFCILRPLTSNRAKQVADVLLDIFNLFGAPVVLQSNEHKDFIKEITFILRETWPDLNVIHVKSRYDETQNNDKHAKQDVENILTAWMQDNKTSKWSEGLRVVQFLRNKMHNFGTKKSPFNEMFGVDPQTNLSSNIFSDQVLQKMILEKPVSEIDESTAESSGEKRKRKQSEGWRDANDSFETREKNVTELLHTKCKGSKGSSVQIKVIAVNNERELSLNINAVILRMTDDGFYQLGCKSGILNDLYVRSQFMMCSENILSLDDILTDKRISLQTATEQCVEKQKSIFMFM